MPYRYSYRFLLPFLAVILLCPFAEALATMKPSTHQVQQGSLVIMAVKPGTQAFLDDRPVAVSDTGDLVFGFGRDAKAVSFLKLISAEGQVTELVFDVMQRQYHKQFINGVAPHFYNKQKSSTLIARIKRETLTVKTARHHVSQQSAFKQPFIWPIKGKLTGVFGSQRVYNGEPGRPHYGVDIAAPAGTAVKAPADGIITLAADLYYSGGTVILDHGLGVSSTFLHLNQLKVKPNDRVKQGQIIATVGSTGVSTGPHLDWRINWLDERLDPQLLMSQEPE